MKQLARHAHARLAGDRPLAALAAAAVYALLALVMVGQGLLPGRTLAGSDYLWSHAPWKAGAPHDTRLFGTNFELADAGLQFQPFVQYTRSRLPDAPLWNPHIMSGRPFLANEQSAVLSPFSAPSYLLPFWKSLAVAAWLKLFVAAFGTYLLGRALAMRFAGALLAGVIFAFGMFFVVWLAWPLGSVFALIPWSLLMTEMVIRRPEPLPVAGLALVQALQYFGGHPESSLHLLVATFAFFALRVRSRRPLGRPIVAFGLALGLGAALAAVVLLPFAELLVNSNQIAHRQGFPSLGPRFLLTLFVPDYWGRSTQTPTQPLESAFFTGHVFYAGTLTLLLATAAIILRPSVERIAIAAFAAIAVGVIVGIEPLPTLIDGLPILRGVKHSRLIILILLCLALLAGWGLDALADRRPSRHQRRLLLGLVAVIVCLPLVWAALRGELVPSSWHRLGRAFEVAWGFSKARGPMFDSHSETAEVVRHAALLGWLVLALAAAILVVARVRARIAMSTFVALAVSLVVLDLFKAGMGFNPAVPVSRATQPTTGAIEYLRSRRPNRFVGVGASGFFPALPPNVGMQYGLYDARGYDFVVERRYDRLWASTVGSTPDEQLPTLATTTPTALRTLSLLSVADLVGGPWAASPPGPGMHLAYHGPDARVYANDRALPRVLLVDRQQVVHGGDEAMAAVTAAGFNGRRVAVTEEALPNLRRAHASSSGLAGNAKLTTYEPERVVVHTRSLGPALLVLTDPYFPGWEVTVDGSPADVHRVDYVLRGVTVPSGAHTVEFRYRPASFTAGLIVTAFALLTVAALAVQGLRRRRVKHPGRRLRET